MRTITYKKLVTNIVYFYPIIYMTLYMFSDSLGRRLAQLVLVVFLYGLLKKLKKRRVLLIFVSIVVFTLFYAAYSGIAYILSLDYYGWILLVLIFSVFTNGEYILELTKYLSNEKKSLLLIRIFYLLLLFSILFLHGLNTENNWGISVPILYGPYEIPHGLSYSLCTIYAFSSALFHKTKKKKYMFYMILTTVCCIWTGARSGILAMAILICADYLSVRKISIKIIIPIIVSMLTLYLGLFTNILTNNPLMQKTMDALSRNNVSNGRGWFNSYLMDCYLNKLNILNKIFGIGVDGVRELMFSKFGTHIHAHNDFLNTLVGFGALGLIIFIDSFYRFVSQTKHFLWPALILIIMAYFNGLYMYIAFTVSIPVFIAYFRLIYANK